MSDKQIEDLVDLMFDTDMEEVMKEKSTLEYIHKLQQENKELKEEIENIKDFNNKLQASKDRLDKDDYNLAHILTELEEWLKEQGNNGIDEWGNHYTVCLYKLNKLKEKYSIGDKE